MSDSRSVDLAALRAWIGRTEVARDTVSPRLVEELCATLDHDPDAAGAKVPHLIHWCLAPAAAKTSSLGADGHPARGGFLPPVPLPRRMWAGGLVTFKDSLRIGDSVERHSRIVDVALKQGRAGALCFVTVEHEIRTARGTAVLERQDIVYSDIVKPANVAAAMAPTPPPEARWRQEGIAGAPLLFRYSALTFNGHRIHYDRSYAVEAEHYPGLVVHGPLQATLLLEFGCRVGDRAPGSFRFRGVKPLFDGVPFSLCAREIDDGLHLWIETAGGVPTTQADLFW